MVELPAQVQRQMEEAEEFERQLAGEPAAAEPQAEPIAPEPAAPAAEITPAAPVEAPKAENWEAKYKSLQGMYNKHVPALQAQVKELGQQVAAIAAQKPAQEVPPAGAIVEPTVTAKDVEVFGSDLVDLVKRQASDLVAQAKAELAAERKTQTTETAELKKRVETVVASKVSDDRHRFEAELTRLCPDWEKVNFDEGFQGWLQEVDPNFDLTKQQGLQNAYDNFDARRTAHIFNQWITANGAPAAQPAVEVPPAKTAAQLQLERQTSPAGSRSETPVASDADATRNWKASEIDAFYSAVRKGEYKGREAEAAAMEANIDLAARTGRVIN